MKKHLAIFSSGIGEKILSGEKQVESRFSKNKQPPFNEVSTGDIVYIKPTGKDIIGEFRVKKVIFIDGLDITELENIKKKYGKQLAVDESFWVGKEESKFVTLIFIGETQVMLTSPITFKKGLQRGWVVLDD